MIKKREIPLYLFTGFLESGKTSFIIETLKEGQFEDGLYTLYILCEEGIEEIDKELLSRNRFETYVIEEEKDISPDLFKGLEKEKRPDRVIIEFNGTWDLDALIEALPKQWIIGEGICTVDASTYENYLNNMKMLMLQQFIYADLILFNRCSADMDLAMYKRTAHAKNRRAQVVFEMEDGSINNSVKEELPYDINSPVIEIGDEDYGLWYLDVFDNLDNYIGKTVRFKAQVFKPPKRKEDIFVPGRFAMTCCAEDIQFVGFPCKYAGAGKLKEKSYVNVTAEVRFGKQPGSEERVPALRASLVEPAAPAEDELVYFT